jgi:DNA-directed RNA polymerase sigma subunit (sigma70/sigma32)
LVRSALHALPERERRLLELRFGFEGDQQTLDATARELSVSRERVRQLERNAPATVAGELEGVVEANGQQPADSAWHKF